ncbi:MAG: tetratricopeptide repeat protein, partial [Candidatus Margulisbacteria bacterium]|nr:tetratricopeptide repeat protein [Candidatus Margulisiibacteriota bacterium]
MNPVLERNRFQRDLQVVPDDPLLHKKMGDVYFAEKNYFAAVEEYKQAAIFGHKHLGNEIVLKFQKAILSNPDEINIRLALAEYYFGLENIVEALEELEEIVEFDHLPAQALKLLSNVAVRLKNREQIIPLLEKAVDHDLNDPTLMNILTSYYLEQNRYQEAAAVYERLLRHKPADVELLQNYVEIKFQLKEYASAADQLKALLNKNPAMANKIVQQIEEALKNAGNNKELLYILAKAYLKDLKPEQAVAVYQKILKNYPEEQAELQKVLKELLTTFPNFPEAYFLLAEIYAKQQQYSEAVSLYNKVIHSNPNLHGEQVIQAYQNIIEQCPQQALAIQSLGEIYLAKKEYPLAIEQFSKLLKLTPDAADFIINKCGKILKVQAQAAAHYLIGKAYLLKKNYVKAIEEGNLIIKNAPDYGGGYAILGEASLAQGKTEAANKALK